MTWELRHIEATITHGDMINENRKNDINNKMLHYKKITTNIINILFNDITRGGTTLNAYVTR